MRICHVVASLEERYGGPSRSVHAVAKAQAQLGHQVTVLCTGRQTTEPADNSSLQLRVLPRDWPERIARSSGLRAALFSTPADILHHHAIWQRPLHYAHRRSAALGIPLVTSPRGMMSRWAWQHHAWRKALARAVIHPGALAATGGWHATSDEEANEIRALGFRQPVCVAPNGVAAPTAAADRAARDYWCETWPAVAQRPTAVFYSRLHCKKRILELVDLWLESAPPDWLLLVVGLPDEYTVPQLERYVLRASGSGRIKVYDGTACPPPFAVASLFLLPSHSENFGLSIAEAMASGVPVVVTDTTPWQAVNGLGAGWCVPWPDYAAAVREALAESSTQRRQRGEIARAYVREHFSWNQCAATLIEFYEKLRAGHG